MKKILISLTLAATAAGAAAQNYLIENPDNRAYFGVRAGLDISSAKGGEDVYVNSPGFHVGAIYQIPIKLNFYFEPGLHFFYDTFGTRITTGIRPDWGMAYELEGSVRNVGFRVPFNFGYHFDFTDNISVSVYTGPVLNFNITAKNHLNRSGIPELDEGLYFSDTSLFGTGGFKRFDMQWQFGVGISYDKYYLTVGGGVGVTKAFNGPVDDKLFKDYFRRNTFNLALGYNF